jgi:hypothetical protein
MTIAKQLQEVREALDWYANEGFQEDVIDVGSCGVASTYDSETACEKAKHALATLDAVIAQMGWQDIATAPKDGTEIIVIFPKCGNVAQLVYYNTIHKYWTSKGKPELGLEHQGCLWQHKPTPPTGEPK